MGDTAGPNSPSEQYPWELSLGEFLDAAAVRNGDKVFAEISGDKITYRQLQQRASLTAGMFRALSVGHGDRVCLFMPNCAEYLYCWFGLSLLGAIGVPINTAYKRDETAFILNDAGASVLVAHHTLVSTAEEAAAMASSVKHKVLVDAALASAPALDKEGIPPDWTNFSSNLRESQGLVALPQVSPDDISMLVYTSGTTGNPKGVMVTHRMYVAAGQGFAHWTQATSDDRFFTCLPFYHANIQYYSTMGALAAGGTWW